MADAWYVALNGQKQGPFTASQLKQMASDGTLGPDALLWKEGMPNWVRAGAAKALFLIGPDGSPAQPARSGPPRVVGVSQRASAIPPRAAAPPPRSSAPSLVFNAEQFPAVQVGLPPGPPPGVVRNGTPDDDNNTIHSTQYADFMPRVGATLLDGLFLILIGGIPLGIVGLIFFVTSASRDSPGLVILVQCAMQVIGLLVGGAYYIFLDSSEKQGTWGKQIVGIKVTDLEGRRISRGRAAGRFFAKYFLSNCTCGIAFLMPLFTAKKQTLHDMISGCLALKR